MKAEDLMIGDYVYIKSSDGEDTHIVKVKTIEENGINQFNGFIEFSELEPIPLTEEILKKNGVEFGDGTASITCPDKSGIIQHTFTFRLLVKICDENIVSGLRYDIFEKSYVDIEDVHDLQHLLRTLYVNENFKIVI